VAKIVDFWLAKFYEPTTPDAQTARLTREGALFGTPAYMSPEQAKGQGEVDHRADLWALGCIVYECLTGQTVWNVEQGVAMILAQIAGAPLPRPGKLRPDLPSGFDRWFARACARDPEARFQNAREMMEALREALGLEAREISMDAPEISVASGGSSAPPSSTTEALTVARDPGSTSGARLSRSRPDTDAATVVANPAENPSDAGVPAKTEALFGTTQHEEPVPPPKSRATLVLVVAMSALAIGLVGGLMVLRERQLGHQETMRLPDPAAPPVEEGLDLRPKKVETAAGPSGEDSESLEERGEGAAADASASGAPAPGASGSLPALKEATADAGAAAAESVAPDGGWQKPAWAQPDNEITIRRGPDQADEKIVLPVDKGEPH
jgi:serine/threonine-protein kinase